MEGFVSLPSIDPDPISNVTENATGLQNSVSNGETPPTAHKDFIVSNMKLYDYTVSLKDKNELRLKYPFLLKAVESFNDDQIIWSTFSVVKSFSDYCDHKNITIRDDEATTNELTTFLNEALNLRKKANSEFEFAISDTSFTICDRNSCNYLIYKNDVDAGCDIILSFGNLLTKGVPNIETILSAMEIFRQWKVFDSCIILGRLSDTRRNENGRNNRELPYSENYESFLHPEEFVHHCTKHMTFDYEQLDALLEETRRILTLD